MEILLHTIAIEPARWTPQRVSKPLVQVLPDIAAAGFKAIEIFGPHLENEADWPEIKATLDQLDMRAVIFSSYLNLRPDATSDEKLEQEIAALQKRLKTFGFSKVRIFPASGLSKEEIGIFQKRVRHLASQIPATEILLETHDGSLADDPPLLVRTMEELDLPNVGLLYQPTFFDAARSLEQFQLEKPFIRHLHLQGRAPDFSFRLLKDGLVPWEQIIPELGDEVGATLEFVPSAICPVEQFDLAASLREAREEIAYVRQLKAGGKEDE